jgi:hypothetical protein
VAKFDHITITILPLIEKGEIVADRLERMQRKTSTAAINI